MKTMKLILTFCLGLIALMANAERPFFYTGNGNEKIYLDIHEGRKVIFCNDPNLDPNPPYPGDTIVRVFRSPKGMLKIYQEADIPNRKKYYPDPTHPKYSIFDCYGIGHMEIATGVIDMVLKNAGDTVLLKQMCKKFHCINEGQIEGRPTWYQLRCIAGDGRNPIEVSNAMYKTGYFAAVCPELWADNMLHISYDPKTTEQWGLYNAKDTTIDINVSRAWNYATGRGVKVAIIDSGFDMWHEDLFGRFYKCYDAENDKELCDTINTIHGTSCAGIIGAIRNNDKGIAGVSPDAMLMPVSALGDSTADAKVVARAIKWCWKNGADVISCSWGGPYNIHIATAFQEATEHGRNGKGCVIVNSAGNISSKPGSSTAITFPGTMPEVIAVGDIQKDGTISPTSCYGPNMCVVAPGTDIISTYPGNRYTESSGTSVAAPFVAGVAALILQRNPDLSHEEVKNIIIQSARRIGPLAQDSTLKFDPQYGYGLVDAYKAVINTPRPLYY